MHRRRRALLGLLLLATVALAVVRLRTEAERVLTARVRQALPPGTTVGAVHLDAWGPLRLEEVAFGGGPVEGRCRRVLVSWSLRGGADPRDHLRGVRSEDCVLAGPGLHVEVPRAAFGVVSWTRQPGRHVLALEEAGSRSPLRVTLVRGQRGELEAVVEAERLLTPRTVHAAHRGLEVAALGTWTVRATLRTSPDGFETKGTWRAEGVRRAAGTPSLDGSVTWDARGARGRVEVRRLVVSGAGAELAVSGEWVEDPAVVALRLDGRADLGAAWRAAELEAPAALPGLRTADLGTATFTLEVSGDPRDPASLAIRPTLAYTAPPRPMPDLVRLRGPFRFTPLQEGGAVLDVQGAFAAVPAGASALPVTLSEGSPGFVPLSAVPHLFQRALLIAEDAGFWGHPGVDVAEVPVALADNWRSGGESIRGASTITQQLVKNLFLSREKSYRRKVQEAVLALLTDAAMGKARILEVYLNVIEWGPGLNGLGPAAWHYFGKRPQELSLKETVFLVCLVPSPVRYHQAHELGRPGPGLEQLMSNLLVKLRSVDAITPAEHAAAEAETLVFRPEEPARVLAAAGRTPRRRPTPGRG